MFFSGPGEWNKGLVAKMVWNSDLGLGNGALIGDPNDQLLAGL